MNNCKSQIYVDLDGVLADFDGHYEELFNEKPDRDDIESPMWDNIHNKTENFFYNLPEFDHTQDLWNGLKKLHPNPIILSGTKYGHGVEEQKSKWVEEHIGKNTPLILCRSKNKFQFGRSGDILLDDWIRYQDNWTKMGGIFVLHNPFKYKDSLETIGYIEWLKK